MILRDLLGHRDVRTTQEAADLDSFTGTFGCHFVGSLWSLVFPECSRGGSVRPAPSR